MERTLDAKFVILSPNDQDRGRLEDAIDRELCEIYIIDSSKIVFSLISQLEKVIFVLDITSVDIPGNLNIFISDLLNKYSEKLLKIILVGVPDLTLSHEKIIQFNSNFIKSDNNVINIINELNIWGDRNYIRFGNSDSRIAFFRMKIKDYWRTGVIHDISASGMSCSFDKHTDIEINEFNTEIELCISDRIFSLTGKFLIRRTFKNNNMFVLVFSRKKTPENLRNLNSIIYSLTRENTLDKIRKLVP